MQSTIDFIEGRTTYLTLRQSRLMLVAVIGEGIANVSTVASVGRVEGISRPTGFFWDRDHLRCP